MATPDSGTMAHTLSRTMMAAPVSARSNTVPSGAIKLLKNYNEQRRKGLDPVFHRDMLPELQNVECWDGTDPVTRRSAEDRRRLKHEQDLGDRTNLREY